MINRLVIVKIIICGPSVILLLSRSPKWKYLTFILHHYFCLTDTFQDLFLAFREYLFPHFNFINSSRVVLLLFLLDERICSPPFMVLNTDCSSDVLEQIKRQGLTFPFSKYFFFRDVIIFFFFLPDSDSWCVVTSVKLHVGVWDTVGKWWQVPVSNSLMLDRCTVYWFQHFREYLSCFWYWCQYQNKDFFFSTSVIL